MKFCISCGIFYLKNFLYCILFSIIETYIYLFIYYDYHNNDSDKNDHNKYVNDKNDNDKNIIINHSLLEESCYCLGYLLNIIPERYSQKKSKEKSVSSKLKGENNKSSNFIEYIYNKSYNENL